jgi:hypothetical protein
MKKNTSKKQVASKGKKEIKEGLAFYIGIDLGDKNSDVCVLDPRGEVGKEFRLRMKEEAFREYFASIPRSRVAVEAGGQSRWVAEVVEKCGHEVYVSNTRKVPYIHQSDAKDDPGDAYKLAELVHFKPRLLHPIQHRSREAQADLSWIRAREVLVESRTQLINAVRGLSKAFAGRLEKCSTESFTAKLAGQVPEAIRSAVAPLLERADRLLRPDGRTDRARAVSEIPVVGTGEWSGGAYGAVVHADHRRSGTIWEEPGSRQLFGDAASETGFRRDQAAVGNHQSRGRVFAQNAGELCASHTGAAREG